jgi:hypothetical protein
MTWSNLKYRLVITCVYVVIVMAVLAFMYLLGGT